VKTSGVIEVSRDIEIVFEFVSSPRRLYGNANSMFRFTEGERQLGVGSVFTAELRVGPIKSAMEYKITDYYRPVRIEWEMSYPQPARKGLWRVVTLGRKTPETPKTREAFELKSSVAGTNLTRSFDYSLSLVGLIPILNGPLGGRLMRRDLRKLKERIEAETEP